MQRMGLDLYPAGRAKPGHEAEWEKFMQTLYERKEETEEAAKRRFAVSIQPWADIGAPRVGYDSEANAWALTEPLRDKNMSDAEVLNDMHGFYVLELMRGKCEGLPKYTHAGMYDLDETSFRGSFLKYCEELLGNDLMVTAWTDCMPPEEAIAYGRELLAVANRASRERIVLVKPEPAAQAKEPPKKRAAEEEMEREEPTLDEKIDILREAGRWYVFWGKRGHPIVAWF
jgi:hypothetical protein